MKCLLRKVEKTLPQTIQKKTIGLMPNVELLCVSKKNLSTFITVDLADQGESSLESDCFFDDREGAMIPGGKIPFMDGSSDSLRRFLPVRVNPGTPSNEYLIFTPKKDYSNLK